MGILLRPEAFAMKWANISHWTCTLQSINQHLNNARSGDVSATKRTLRTLIHLVVFL